MKGHEGVRPVAMNCDFSVEGTGPPLFLIHGIGAARDAWRLVVPILRNHFTVVIYDLRGHGESPMPSSEFGLEELVAEAQHQVDGLGERVRSSHDNASSLRGEVADQTA